MKSGTEPYKDLGTRKSNLSILADAKGNKLRAFQEQQEGNVARVK